MKNKSNGFTLIEIMVVVVIAAILMGAVTLSFPRTGDDLLKEQANRFAAIISLSQDEAILQSKDLALAVGEAGYSFLRKEDNSWQVFDEPPFNARSLVSGIATELLIEGVSVNLKTKKNSSSSNDDKKVKPQVLILSSGEMTPFTYMMTYSNKSSVTIKVNAIGGIEQIFKQEDN